jgi:hypothetical protein
LQNHAAEADGFVRSVGISLQFRIDRDQPIFAADFHTVTGKEYHRHIGARGVAPDESELLLMVAVVMTRLGQPGCA